MVSLNDLLRSQLKDIKSADQTVTIQMKNHEDLNSKVEMIKNKIESKNVKIQQAFEEIKITENWISNLKENIKQANNSIIELSIQDTIKQQRIQELLSQIAKKNLKTTTPLKQKKKVRSSLKGCRNSQARTVSTMTPSTAGENSNRKLIIKRLEMSKLKNSATVDTEISTPEYNQIPLVSPKYYSNNWKSFQSSEYQGSMYGKSWDPSSSRNSILGARKTSQKNIPQARPTNLKAERIDSTDVKKRITENKKKSHIESELAKMLQSVCFLNFNFNINCEFR